MRHFRLAVVVVPGAASVWTGCRLNRWHTYWRLRRMLNPKQFVGATGRENFRTVLLCLAFNEMCGKIGIIMVSSEFSGWSNLSQHLARMQE